jgi:hypothetical protein
VPSSKISARPGNRVRVVYDASPEARTKMGATSSSALLVNGSVAARISEEGERLADMRGSPVHGVGVEPRDQRGEPGPASR